MLFSQRNEKGKNQLWEHCSNWKVDSADRLHVTMWLPTFSSAERQRVQMFLMQLLNNYLCRTIMKYNVNFLRCYPETNDNKVEQGSAVINETSWPTGTAVTHKELRPRLRRNKLINLNYVQSVSFEKPCVHSGLSTDWQKSKEAASTAADIKCTEEHSALLLLSCC